MTNDILVIFKVEVGMNKHESDLNVTNDFAKSIRRVYDGW